MPRTLYIVPANAQVAARSAFVPYGNDSRAHTISLGYSTVAIFISLAAVLVISFIPMAVGLRRVQAHVPTAGSDSIVIATACHPVPSSPEPERTGSRAAGMAYVGRAVESSEVDQEIARSEIVKGKLKWGVLKEPDDTGRRRRPGHLGFGTEAQVLRGVEKGEKGLYE